MQRAELERPIPIRPGRSAAPYPPSDHGARSHVRLADVLPDLDVPRPEAGDELARRLPDLRALRAAQGPWTPPPWLASALGVVVLDGTLVQERVAFGHPAVRLFGPEDVIDPWLLADEDGGWRVLGTVELAVVDARYVVAARRWPELIGSLTERLLEAQRHQHDLAAIAMMPRVEQRVLALLGYLAGRWGRVTPDGVALELATTHELLGHLVGARRPTVSLALTALGAQGLVRRLPDGRWLLPPDCPFWASMGIPEVRATAAA